MKWKKLGKIFAPKNNSELMQEYARIPILDLADRQNSSYKLYFGSRDVTNRERVFSAELNLNSLTVENINPKPVLDFGENLGAFDDNGITPCCILNYNNRKLMYYCGWNIHVKDD